MKHIFSRIIDYFSVQEASSSDTAHPLLPYFSQGDAPEKIHAHVQHRLLQKSRKKRKAFRLIGLAVIMVCLAAGAYRLYMVNKSAEASWYSSSWQYRKLLTINANSVSGGTNLTNFPVMVYLNGDPNLLTAAQSDGDDILFTSYDGTKLDHEIESYSNGTLVAWVEIPTVSATVNTSFYMYYGNPSASSQQNPSGVWDTNYKGVWHLGEATAATRSDSTTNNNDLTDVNSVTKTAGYNKSNAADFEVSNSQDLEIANASQTGLGITGNLTIEAWLKAETGGVTQVVAGKYGSSGNAGYMLRYSNGDSLTFNLSSDGSASTNFNSTTSAAPDVWYHLVGVYDGTNTYVYVNGTLEKTTAYSAGIFATTERFEIGGRGGSSQQFDGIVDEVRVSNAARTGGWITTEYNNQSSPGTFFTPAGAQETRDHPVAFWKFDEGAENTCIGGTNDICDGSTQGHDGTNSSATRMSDSNCLFGKCLSFDGTSSYLSIPDSDDFSPASTPMSVSFWARVPTNANAVGNRACGSSGAYFMAKGSGTDWDWGMENDLNSMVCFLVWTADGSSSTQVQYSMTVNDDKWHFYTATVNFGTSMALYIDSKLVDSTTTFSTTTANGTQPLLIGKRSDGNYFQGYMDNVKIYDVAQSSDQVKRDFASRGSDSGVAASLGGPNPDWSLSNGLVAYWKLDETTANTCTGLSNDSCDSSGNAHDGLWVDGATTTTSGKFGSSLSLDGTLDDVTVPDSDDFTPDNPSFSAWIYLTTLPSVSTKSAMIIRKAHSTSPFNAYQFYVNTSDVLRFEWYQSDGSSQAITGTQTLSLNTWYHVAVAKDGTNVRAYLNGNLEASRTDLNSTAWNTDSTFYIGGNGNSAFLYGKIDDVRVYNRPLSASEIRSLANWGPDPVLYYPLDEHTGTSTVQDISGNSNIGTMTNMASKAWTTGKYGSALTFDGVDDDIEVTSPTSDDLWMSASQDFTVSTWVKGGFNSAGNTLIRKGNSSKYSFDLSYDTGDDSVNFARYDGTNNPFASGTISIKDNKWHYVTGVKSGSTLSIYFDGILNASTADSTTLANLPVTDASSTTFYVGSRGSFYYKGTLDDIKVYKYARTPSQIIEDMNGGHPIGGSPVGSQAVYYKFDEGAGTSATSINDSSPNQYTAGFNPSNPGTWSSSCKVNTCLTFDDTHFGVRRANLPLLDGLAQMSVSMWVNPTTLTVNRVLASQSNINLLKSSCTDCGFTIAEDGTNSDEIRVYIHNTVTDTSNYYLTSNLNLANSTWDHLVIVYDGTQPAANRVQVYKNGHLISGSVVGATGIPSTMTTTTAAKFYVGASDGADVDVFNGSIDEFKLYTAALTQEDINIDYNQGSAIVLGALSTNSGNTAPDNSSARSYCVPGDTSTCSAPVGEWKMDEHTGTTGYDTSGNGNNGSLTGKAKWASGCKFGSCLATSVSNGTVDSLTITDPASGILDFNTAQSFTTEAWFKIGKSESDYAPLWKGGQTTGTAGYDIEVASSDHQARCHYVGANAVSESARGTSDIYQDNKWHNVTCVMDRSGSSMGAIGLYIFVDGKLEGSDTSLGASTGVSTQNLIIGEGIDSGFEFNGLVDTARIYNYARTPAQVAWDYNRGGPVAWYKLDECTGSTVYDNARTANGDATGINGTISIGGGGTNTSAGTCNGSSSEAWKNGANGKFNSALNFDGSDDYVFTTTSTGLDVSNYTISAWANFDTVPSGTTDSYIVERGTTGVDTPTFYLWVDANGTVNGTGVSQIVYGFHISGGAFTDHVYSFTPTTNTWYHMAVVYNKTTIKLYINGLEVDSENETNTPDTSGTQQLFFGTNRQVAAGKFFDGELDDIRVYNYPMTATQIKTLYNENASVRFAPVTGSP